MYIQSGIKDWKFATKYEKKTKNKLLLVLNLI